MLTSAELAGICAGAAFVVVAPTSSLAIARRRRRRRIDAALFDPNPAARIAALELLAQRGVSGHLAALVDRVLLEEDPGVQAVLARTLGAAQWDATADRRLLVLRTWAMRRVSAPPPYPDARAPAATAQAPEAQPAAGELGRGADHTSSTDSALPEGTEPEYEELEDNELRVMEWLLSAEPLGAPPRPGPASSTGHGAPVGDRSTSVAKAEQRAIGLLQDAGYAVTPGNVHPGRRSQPASRSETPATANEASLLRQLGAEQSARLRLLEQLILHVQGENARLEAELARLSEHTEN